VRLVPTGAGHLFAVRVNVSVASLGLNVGTASLSYFGGEESILLCTWLVMLVGFSGRNTPLVVVTVG